jgi:hypothetical protein
VLTLRKHSALIRVPQKPKEWQRQLQQKKHATQLPGEDAAMMDHGSIEIKRPLQVSQ